MTPRGEGGDAMNDLAAIVARDAAGPAGPGELTWDRMFAVEDDRRALLALLRETRDALRRHLNEVCRCLGNECRSCETGNPILTRLAALDTEATA